uniref:Conserved oligomeric Golgi complex subunit 4 n=1 Tax=Elaeophora elaphi TaxID=1147741 RepID=A0A0R3RI04_9BILA
MLSELIISSTLLLNAFTVINFKLSKANHFDSFVIIEGEDRSVADRIRDFLQSLRSFRIFIALWNIFIISLMFFMQSVNINGAVTMNSATGSAAGTCNKWSEIRTFCVDVPNGSLRSKPKRPEDLQFDFDDVLSNWRRQMVAKVEEEEALVRSLDEMLHKTSVNGAEAANSDISLSFNLAVTRLKNQMTLVLTLDVAKGRVVECLQRASDLMDLHTCADGVRSAIEQEDYELAARHIHKFLTLDTTIFRMGDHGEAKDVGQSMGKSYEILREAANEMKSIIEKRFDQAVVDNDVASIQRFFKLFPLLNEHAKGIKRIGDYLCVEIHQFAERNYKVMLAGGTDDKRINVLYADALTMLFEAVAREIQVYEPLIGSSYGPDKLLSLIEILQRECDKEAERIIVAFIKNRQFDSKAKMVEKITRNSDKHVLDKIDALELDVLLSEVTMMHTRTHLYWRYLRRRLNMANMKTDEQQKELDEDQMNDEYKRLSEEARAKQKRERSNKLDDLVLRSLLGTRMQELLGQYVLMEQFYMTESVAKAMTMDLKEVDSLTSSMLDDVFFIIRKCVRRSLSSLSVDCTCAVLNNGVTALEADFLKYIFQDIKSGYPGAGWTAEAYQTAQTAYNVIQHGKMVTDSGPEKLKEAFLTALNNVNELEKGKLENAISQLDDLVRKFDSSANVGVDKLCASAFRPKLKPVMELYLSVTHTPSENEFADFEAEDPFMDNFIATLDRQLAAFEPLLIPVNYQELLVAVCAEVSMQFERVIMKSVYNRLGGLQLDKDFRSLSSYLTNVAGWIVREKCARLSQIVSIINVDSVGEAEECFHQLQHHNLTLTSDEAMKALVLRIDLSSDAIKNASF